MLACRPPDLAKEAPGLLKPPARECLLGLGEEGVHVAHRQTAGGAAPIAFLAPEWVMRAPASPRLPRP